MRGRDGKYEMPPFVDVLCDTPNFAASDSELSFVIYIIYGLTIVLYTVSLLIIVVHSLLTYLSIGPFMNLP